MTTESSDERLIIDTDVLIDYLRGQSEAVAYLEGLNSELLISAITLAELYAGVREGSERTQLETFSRAFGVLPLDRNIALNGGIYRRDYKNSHGTGLPDALIAATAESVQARLVTLNRRHFPMLTDVIVPYSK